jgi:nucleotide-binding universal stress UspA family protein
MPGIVLTTDLSNESKRAFVPVRELAQQLRLDVTLLAIVEDVLFEATAGGLMAVYPDRTRIRADWESALSALADEFGRDVCKTAVVLEAADVPRAICDYAHRERASFLAMATHGRSGLRRLLLGSIAEQVARHAHVPILLYPPPAAPAAAP